MGKPLQRHFFVNVEPVLALTPRGRGTAHTPSSPQYMEISLYSVCVSEVCFVGILCLPACNFKVYEGRVYDSRQRDEGRERREGDTENKRETRDGEERRG